MERQAKSGKSPVLESKTSKLKRIFFNLRHIKQKLIIGFLPNLLHQTRLILVHLFVYGDIVMQSSNCVTQQHPFPPLPISSFIDKSHFFFNLRLFIKE